MTNQYRAGKKALVIGGGAPNSTLIAGALTAFIDEGIEFDVISASGAGVLMGLLYQAPLDCTPREALVRWAEVGVADSIYKMFPVNYKIFNKPGQGARSFRDQAPAQMPQLAGLPNMAAASGMPGNPFLDVFTQRFTEASGAWSDWMHLMLSAMSPSDLSSKSLGLCAHHPFLEQAIDFDAIARMKPEFYINAYNMNKAEMQIWDKDEIAPINVRAALSFPFLYPPTEIDGDDYIEGAALDTLNFNPLTTGGKHDDIDTLVVLDILGEDRLIRKPRNLYDAWVRSIITPLVKISKTEMRLFELEHNTNPDTGEPLRRLLKVDLMSGIPDEHWPEVLDWSASNMQLLFDVGYRAGKAFCREHGESLQNAFEGTPLAA
ncbi:MULTISPECIES: patatin-like phospholipase family protein [unclassified Herbaspirillum]|nr:MULTISPECIES: patatin-like phospholipase family protein [unclassified Herbaspirillum]RFB68031.1 patatin-like phospholipase family protein [Herbaspirillum sp. 3R-3a1]TFI06474.1 patatin-like phospholipase family protein [Herbaspirillum sp. 3R11]TFI13914.1 patatin-like phospholipase family protein [Herbaspirillum sp. 3R-11]